VDIGTYEYNLGEFRIIDISAHPANGVSLTWTSEIGENYDVLRSTNLKDWNEISPSLKATSGLTEWTDPDPPKPSAFYSIRRR
jgi:hypothetical protein